MITVHYDEKPIYDIYIEKDYGRLKEAVNALGDLSNRKACIVSETNVAPLYLKEVKKLLEECFGFVTEFIFPAGEENKNLTVIENLYEHLILNHLERKDYLIALGGGVTGDMTGYAAATYLRGISFIQMPTTLLSQVDSSIGGKTGVDFRSYKNMVGAFHQPSLVYMNLSTLNTLTKEQYCEGMGEIIKHGLIKDVDYYHWLDQNMDAILERDQDTLSKMIEVSCNIKRRVVEADPKEKGERALLNFGHTLGHAVEKVCGFSHLHGECVSLGCVAASWLSYKRGMITEEEYQDVRKVLGAAMLPVSIQDTNIEDAMEAIRHDKKMEAGRIKFILLNHIGEAVIDTTVSHEEMRKALEVIIEGE